MPKPITSKQGKQRIEVPLWENLQAYVRSFEDMFFFEFVERCGYKGFGAVNAPIRLAAQARLARHPAVPRA